MTTFSSSLNSGYAQGGVVHDLSYGQQVITAKQMIALKGLSFPEPREVHDEFLNPTPDPHDSIHPSYPPGLAQQLDWGYNEPVAETKKTWGQRIREMVGGKPVVPEVPSPDQKELDELQDYLNDYSAEVKRQHGISE